MHYCVRGVKDEKILELGVKTHKMSSTDSKMLKYAKKIAGQAIAFDRAKNYREATTKLYKSR